MPRDGWLFDRSRAHKERGDPDREAGIRGGKKVACLRLSLTTYSPHFGSHLRVDCRPRRPSPALSRCCRASGPAPRAVFAQLGSCQLRKTAKGSNIPCKGRFLKRSVRYIYRLSLSYAGRCPRWWLCDASAADFAFYV
jgi:hypothetical protein